MKVSIIGCGESAKDWNKIPVDLSIGVNDCWKFGYPTDWLVVVNSPGKFKPSQKNGHIDRFKTIVDSTPKMFFCHMSSWKAYFPKAEYLNMRQFHSTFKKGRIYFSKTSPFVAITLAAAHGATEIILWGIDMLNHHRFNPGSSDQVEEKGYYLMLFEGMEKEGIKVWLGDENSCFKGHLSTYKSISSNSEVMEK